MAGNEKVRIQLTDDQMEQIRKATGKDAKAIELSVQELEDRVSPKGFSPPTGG